MGWRYEISDKPNGEQIAKRIPLTPEEVRHPKEDYIVARIAELEAKLRLLQQQT